MILINDILYFQPKIARVTSGASSGRDIAQPGGPKKDIGGDKGGPKTSKPVPTVAIPEAPASWKR